jgi:hypothetical protein
MRELKSFLLEMSKDPQLLDAYRDDRETVLADAGLAPRDREALASGNVDLIRSALGVQFDFFIIIFLYY